MMGVTHKARVKKNERKVIVLNPTCGSTVTEHQVYDVDLLQLLKKTKPGLE